jgi:phenylpropionate dioxygenase-like ring-hydroxylating dioxygenase large terminal subunit
MRSPVFRVEPEWYWSRERAEQEWRHVWTRLWHLGPRVEELPAAGDVMVHTLGHESLLFVRDADGRIRGYFNVCRHRGNRLLLAADGPSCAREFHCAFHGWRYALDGRLVHVPHREKFAAEALADAGRTSLKEFRVEAFAGWTWFSLDPDAPRLLDYLGPVAPRLQRYRMERAHIVDYKTFEFACNWKTVFDAFNESYHFQTLHSEILSWGNEVAPITLLNIHSMMVNEYGAPSPLYGDRRTLNPALEALLRQNGIEPATFAGDALQVRRALQQAKRSRQDGSVFPYAELTDGQLTDAYHFALFPSTHLNLFPEFYVAMRYRPHPSGDPERMYFDFIMCAPLAAGEEAPTYTHRVVRGGEQPVGDVLEWGARRHPVVDQVLGQDVGLVEHVQRGQRSSSFAGALLGSDERRIAHFHETIGQLIAGRSIHEIIASSVTEADAHDGS